jgi:hypothetical protein
MNKEKLETVFKEANLRPVAREKMGDYDLFIGDGFSNSPHLRYQRFGVEPDEFPAGMFVTFWWLGRGEKLHVGRPLFMKLSETSLDARLNAARKDAEAAVKKLRKHNGAKRH